MAGSAASSPRRLPRAERERQMLDAAHALFSERGYLAVTMDDVAAAVGVTKPLLYSYWGNKERLFIACMERSAQALFDAVLGAIERSADPSDAVEAATRAFFAFVDEDRAAWRVVFDPSLPAAGDVATAVAQERAKLTGLIADAFLALLPEGTRERARTDVEARSHAILGAAEALARWWLATGAMPAQRAADLLIETVVPGLPGAAPTPRRTSR